VAALTDGRVGQRRADEVLGALAKSGIVLLQETADSQVVPA
jgi:hypothetical protein